MSSKKQTIYAYKLHVLLTAGGVIVDFILAPADADDVVVGEELLAELADLRVFGDKAYISHAVQARLQVENRIQLVTVPPSNQRVQLPERLRTLINQARQIIETVKDQLTEPFHLEHNHAHSFWGLCTRLMTKLTAHTLCIYLNRLLGKADFLQIKQLAFPI